MDRQITIWCSKCGHQIDGADNAYCMPCIDGKDEELAELEGQIEELKSKINELEKKEVKHPDRL